MGESCQLNRHRPDFLLDFSGIDHRDSVPRATVEEAAIRPLAQALLAPDAQNWIHLDSAERRMILIRHPEHAVFHRAVLHACRRSGAPRAALGNDRQFFGFLLARGGKSFGLGFELLFVGDHPDSFIGSSRGRRHARHYSPKSGERSLNPPPPDGLGYPMPRRLCETWVSSSQVLYKTGLTGGRARAPRAPH